MTESAHRSVPTSPSTDDKIRERLRKALRLLLEEWGLHQTANQSYHGWRCEHPDRYGKCDCFEELMDDLPKSLLAAYEEARK